MADDDDPARYYRARIAAETAAGEPELALVSEFVRPGSLALDVGANEGIYAFALSEAKATVHAFEPSPDFAAFAARMLGERAQVHELALSDAPGRATFYVPLADDGSELHLAGNLKNSHAQFENQKRIDVAVATLDSFAFRDVSFIKIDVEGSEPEVLAGGRETILRDRPVLLLELLSGTYADPLAVTAAICAGYGYDAFVVHQGARLDAAGVIKEIGKNTTWGTPYATRNVLFMPR